jgi:hypothetical protein
MYPALHDSSLVCTCCLFQIPSCLALGVSFWQVTGDLVTVQTVFTAQLTERLLTREEFTPLPDAQN